MSSSQQFPSGLNNWVDSDKPIREDFVQDNRLLDENALWKQDYDSDGSVAGAGGMAAYVQANTGMREADYDPEGTVKAAGGIPAYVTGSFVLNLVYPVGSIYMSVASTSPEALFGGTWVPFATGSVLVGVDAAQEEFKTVEKTGGKKNHTLTAGEMPQHSHNFILLDNVPGGVQKGPLVAKNGTNHLNFYTGGSGGSAAHNNLQPYITCYIWKRTT